ncbi:helix-turn-helix domain-containing protein [Halomarina litorea]|uniref:helix-turn-helix domain-containing protein n=1 Tax=Halomarina litorea TaxID=2961595 RepID=UPI0020C2E337|nr:helix-turn-helix domain-containing protein [Halomarina sp. BCD28]
MTSNTTNGVAVLPAVPDDGQSTTRDGDGSGDRPVPTLAELRLPADRVALGAAFRREPALTCRIERVAAGRPDRPFTFAWLGGTDRQGIEEALAADPSVELRRMLAERDGQWLAHLAFDESVALVAAVVTGASGVVCAALAREGAWRLHLRFPSRDDVGATVSHLDRFGFEADLTHIREAGETDDLRLTEKQRETIEAAYRQGYFEVPRRVSLGELAEDLDVSHQALSERLRRAQQALMRFELADTPAPVETERA